MPRRPRTEEEKAARRAEGFQYGSKDPAYNEAKHNINTHLWRHHERHSLSGTLEQRISGHDELHFASKREGVDLGHEHVPLGEGETLFEYAHRCFSEGEGRYGETDTTRSAREAAPVDRREGNG